MSLSSSLLHTLSLRRTYLSTTELVRECGGTRPNPLKQVGNTLRVLERQGLVTRGKVRCSRRDGRPYTMSSWKLL